MLALVELFIRFISNQWSFASGPWNGSYTEYLRSEHWKVTRSAIVKRDGNRCRVCNSGTKLNVHHRTYERLGEELPTDLITLCEDCHHLFHKHLRLVKHPTARAKKGRSR